MSPLELIVTVQAVLLTACIWLLVRAWVWIGRRIDEYTETVNGDRQLPLHTPAPDFGAVGLDGARVGLDDLRGRQALLVFSMPGCAQCEVEMPVVERLAAEADPLAWQVLGVTTGSRKTVDGWVASLVRRGAAAGTLKIVVEASRDGAFIDTYNPAGITPYFVALDRDGNVANRGLIPGVEWDSTRRAVVAREPAVPLEPGTPSSGTRRLAPWSV